MESFRGRIRIERISVNYIPIINEEFSAAIDHVFLSSLANNRLWIDSMPYPKTVVVHYQTKVGIATGEE